MTPYMQSPSSKGNTLHSTSAAGMQQALLALLRNAAVKRGGRVADSRQRHQMELMVHSWHHVCKHGSLTKQRKEQDDASLRRLKDEQDRQERRLVDIRREWKDQRDVLVKDHGYEQDDHIAMRPEKVNELRDLDKEYREKLNKMQQDHLRKRDHMEAAANIEKEKSQKQASTTALAQWAMNSLKPKNLSRSDQGRSWRSEDMDTGLLQWAFTQPIDSCFVPFPQAVQMKEQQQVLADTARLIFEYSDKLPRWTQLASVNQGRVPKQPPAAAAMLMKSILRRLLKTCLLQPAFRTICEHASTGRFRKSSGLQAWDRLRSASGWQNIKQLRSKEQQAKEDEKTGGLDREASQHHSENSASRKTVFIDHLDPHQLKRRSRPDGEAHSHSKDLHEESARPQKASLSSDSSSEAGMPFHLGDDYRTRSRRSNEVTAFGLSPRKGSAISQISRSNRGSLKETISTLEEREVALPSAPTAVQETMSSLEEREVALPPAPTAVTEVGVPGAQSVEVTHLAQEGTSEESSSSSSDSGT